MATLGEDRGPALTNVVAKELAQEFGVIRLVQIIKSHVQSQSIPLIVLSALFEKKAEQEERGAIGNTWFDVMQIMQRFSNIFIIERGLLHTTPQEICVRLTDHASFDYLPLLSGVLKLQNILKQKGRLNIRQLSTFCNQNSSVAERKVVGKNPAALKQTVQALPSIFAMSGDFITIKVKYPTDSSDQDTVTANNSDCESQTGSIKMYPENAPISYASAVTINTVNDDENARARRAGLSKIRNHIAEFKTSTITQMFDLLETQGTTDARRAVGEDLDSFRASLKGLPGIFTVNDQFVDLVSESARVNGLAKIFKFLKSRGSCEAVQLCSFMGHQGTREEREALGKNPQRLIETLKQFSNIFTVIDGGRVSLFTHGKPTINPQHNVSNGLPASSLPSICFKGISRTRNESVGVDSGYEGSVTFDQSERNGSGDADVQLPPCKPTGEESISKEAHVNFKISAIPTYNADDGDEQPNFIMADVSSNDDVGFKEFKREYLDKYVSPIVGIALSEDYNWLAISGWADDKVYMVDICACSADASRNDDGGVCNVLKDVLQSNTIVKIVYDCRRMAASLHTRFGYSLVNVFDTMIAHQILSCNDSTSLDELCCKYGDVPTPNKWCATIAGCVGWKVLDSGGYTSDIGLAACARVLVPHLYQQMVVRFGGGKDKEVLRLCEQVMQTSQFGVSEPCQ